MFSQMHAEVGILIRRNFSNPELPTCDRNKVHFGVPTFPDLISEVKRKVLIDAALGFLACTYLGAILERGSQSL